VRSIPPSSEYGTYKIVQARFWPGPSGEICSVVLHPDRPVDGGLTALCHEANIVQLDDAVVRSGVGLMVRVQGLGFRV